MAEMLKSPQAHVVGGDRSAVIAALQEWSDQKFGSPFSVSACNDLLNALHYGHGVPEIPTWKDQFAFEEWAKGERYEMHQHPLHYLFLDPKTHAARMGWKAGMAFARAALIIPSVTGDTKVDEVPHDLRDQRASLIQRGIDPNLDTVTKTVPDSTDSPTSLRTAEMGERAE